MLSLLLLPIAACIPFVFSIYGKRIFGAQTHPISLFILSWIAMAVTLAWVPSPGFPSGELSLIWVVFCFTLLAIIRKLRKKRDTD